MSGRSKALRPDAPAEKWASASVSQDPVNGSGEVLSFRDAPFAPQNMWGETRKPNPPDVYQAEFPEDQGAN